MAVQGGELAAGAEPGGAADAESGDGLLGGAGVPEQRGDVVVGLAVAEVGPREGTRAMVAHAMEKVGHSRQQDWEVVVPAGGGQPVRQVRLIVGELLGELSRLCDSIVAEDESLLPPGDKGSDQLWGQFPVVPAAEPAVLVVADQGDDAQASQRMGDRVGGLAEAATNGRPASPGRVEHECGIGVAAGRGVGIGGHRGACEVVQLPWGQVFDRCDRAELYPVVAQAPPPVGAGDGLAVASSDAQPGVGGEPCRDVCQIHPCPLVRRLAAHGVLVSPLGWWVGTGIQPMPRPPRSASANGTRRPSGPRASVWTGSLSRRRWLGYQKIRTCSQKGKASGCRSSCTVPKIVTRVRWAASASPRSTSSRWRDPRLAPSSSSTSSRPTGSSSAASAASMSWTAFSLRWARLAGRV